MSTQEWFEGGDTELEFTPFTSVQFVPVRNTAVICGRVYLGGVARIDVVRGDTYMTWSEYIPVPTDDLEVNF